MDEIDAFDHRSDSLPGSKRGEWIIARHGDPVHSHGRTTIRCDIVVAEQAWVDKMNDLDFVMFAE
ncbi:hypothetical protein GCM10007269_14120 [Microbacterium murale]|uniref:Uncharacterized protein n=1 Tax=Microbacterium murale TaxID=1081040 RepID=A0ABQ1RMS3_9MICO|nr:hypothetical protein [Microbacterium murale]GGD72139.1 hypothetical protein GCM10007269_14120 [Microbacterium murale]